MRDYRRYPISERGCSAIDAEYKLIGTCIYDQCEIHPDCTVQILRNSVTGEVSVGWWENKPTEQKGDDTDEDH